MSKDANNDSQNKGEESRSDDAMLKLMNLAGPRAGIPADVEKRVHENVRQHWQGGIKQKRIARWAIPVSLAATALLVLAMNVRSPEITPPTIGTIAFVDSTANSSFVVGEPILAGANIETAAESGLSITLKGDVSLRIAANSSVHLDDSDEITLFSGQIYADSGERIYRDRHLTVNTANGTATDIGTQFSVAYANDLMSVAVREGQVDVAHEQSVFSAMAGDRVTLQTGSDLIVDKVMPYDPTWDWAVSLAPDFDIKNRSLLDFLKWAARETGKTLSFADDDIRMTAMGTQVVGSIENFTPREAIDAVLATTQFDYDIDEQSITIRK